MNKPNRFHATTMEELMALNEQLTRPPRDPARINKILKLLKKYWTAPGRTDLRLAQIIMNLYGKPGDPYNFEDDDLIKALEKVIADV